MYGSETDHARVAYSHRAGHALRSNSEMGEGDRIEWSTPKARILATKRYEREAIAEGLAEHAEALEAEALERDYAECMDAMVERAFDHFHAADCG